MKLAKSILSIPWVYRMLQHGLGVSRLWLEYIETYVRPTPGGWIMDVGCGPADILDSLPGIHYVGVDASPEYIREAQTRYGQRGDFVCRSISDYACGRPNTFDVVMANGVLHHLNDKEAADLFRTAHEALKAGGRLVTIDPCFVPNQSRLTKWMLRNDRGHYVRRPEQYAELASSSFSRVGQYVRHDLLRIPYTHVIMVCEAAVEQRRHEHFGTQEHRRETHTVP